VKRLSLIVIVAALSPISAFAQPAGLTQPESAPKAAPAKSGDVFKTDEQKTLYALGLALSQQMKQAVASFSLTAADNKFVLMGIRDAFMGEKPKVEMSVYGPKISELGQARAAVKASKEKEKAKPFLDKMAKESGAQKSASGLIYFEVKAGTGASPTATDTVKAQYKGTLIDGTVFDASAKHGDKPLEFPLNGVIPCWTEGIQKMKVGGKSKLICPPDIGYGDRGTGGVIPGGATLIFDVELVDIVKK